MKNIRALISLCFVFVGGLFAPIISLSAWAFYDQGVNLLKSYKYNMNWFYLSFSLSTITFVLSLAFGFRAEDEYSFSIKRMENAYYFILATFYLICVLFSILAYYWGDKFAVIGLFALIVGAGNLFLIFVLWSMTRLWS